jgi:predicted methyltransferase
MTERRKGCADSRAILSLLAAALLTTAACAQNSGPARDRWQRPDEVMDALGIHAGSVVADVGCGRGYFTMLLARRVGPEGKVYAEDINDDVLADVRRDAKQEGLKQVEEIHGAPDDPHLPAGSLDVVLTVNSYHEWRQYDQMLRQLYQALKPGGLFGLIDGVAEPGQAREVYQDEHRMPESMERDDLTRNGFHLRREAPGFTRQDDGKKFYFLIFEKPAAH